MSYLYIAGCIVFTVYGQLIIKWRINAIEGIPEGFVDKAGFLTKLVFTDFLIFSGLLSAFLAALFWMAAMSKFPLSFAYPFMSLAFVLVVFLSVIFFNEELGVTKLVGVGLILVGIVVLSQGYRV